MRRAVGSVLAVALLLTGCAGGDDGGDDPSPVTSPLAGCEGLTEPPPDAATAAAAPAAATVRTATVAGSASAETATAPGSARMSAAAPGPPGRAQPMPQLSLPCFTGEAQVSLAALRGPAVVNLWASWCRPCREELPALQRLADRTAGQLHVLGVVTADRRRPAAALADDFDLRFPSLFDPQQLLSAELGRFGVPMTLFVDRAGELVHVHQAEPFDDAELAALVAEHLRVDVRG